MAVREQTLTDEPGTESWVSWPVNWSAVWVGALASLAAVVVFGLIGTAIGAHVVGPEHRVVDLAKVPMITLIFSVFSAFLAFVIGGWATGKIAGILDSDRAMLHGAISWLIAVPILVLVCAFGAGSYLGGWHSNLGGHPSWAAPVAAPYERPEAIQATATEAERQQYTTALADYQSKMRQWREDTPRATRNAAIGALAALLMGLIGSTIGGWWASGEPMSLTYYRTRRTGQLKHAV